MNRRILLLLLLLVLVGAGALFLLTQTNLFNPQPTQPPAVAGNETPIPGTTPSATLPPIPVVEVIVSLQELPRGSKIPEGALAVRRYPRNAIPERAILAGQNSEGLRTVTGKIARTKIYVEQIIVDTVLTNDLAELEDRGSDAAAITPQGRVLISVPVDRLTAVGYAIRSGDYVDIIASFLFVDVDPNFQTIKPNRITLTSIKQDGTIELQTGIEGELVPSQFSQFPVVAGPSEKQRPRLVTQRTIQAAWVIHTGTFPLVESFLRPVSTPRPTNTPAEGQPTPAAPPPTPTTPFPDIITIAVEPQDAVTIAWLIESRIPLTMVLKSARGNPQERDTQQTSSVSLQYIIETYQVGQPPSLPYALEPALRSIRSLFVGNQISLVDAK